MRQKLLTAVIVVAGAGLFATLIYSYERYHRGPSESAFYGTWRDEADPGEVQSGFSTYWEFHPDQTFSRFMLSKYAQERSDFSGGHWYAGGRNLYLTFDSWYDDDTEKHRVLVCGFDITADHLGIGRPDDDAAVWFLRRVDHPEHLTRR